MADRERQQNSAGIPVHPVIEMTDAREQRKKGGLPESPGQLDNSEEGQGSPGIIATLEKSVADFLRAHRKKFKYLLYIVGTLFLHGYVALACVHDTWRARFLLAAVVVLWCCVIFRSLYRPYLSGLVESAVAAPFRKTIRQRKGLKWLAAAFLSVALLVFIVWDVWAEPARLVGLGGMAAILFALYASAAHRGRVRWWPVVSGLLVQLVIGLLVLRWDTGRQAFGDFCDQVVIFLRYSEHGTRFVYGFAASPPPICGLSPIFAFSVLQIVIYVGAVVSVLYYWGIVQAFAVAMGRAVSASLQTTAVESLYAVTCIFLGLSEAPLLVRAYLVRLTLSELHAVLAIGFSCTAGAAFAAYVSFGACPVYLLSSTLMSAPGSLALAKLHYPETEASRTKKGSELQLEHGDESSALEALSAGAVTAASIVIAILANLIVFIALLAFLDATVAYAGELVGVPGFSFQLLLGYICFPLAYVMGITGSIDETILVGRLMGTKTALNEFIAYQQLGELVEQGKLTARASMIATYALCGFSNFGSIGIQLGTFGMLVPERKADVSRLVVRALFVGSMCCFYTAALAGVIVSEPMACPRERATNCFNVTLATQLLQNAHTEL